MSNGSLFPICMVFPRRAGALARAGEIWEHMIYRDVNFSACKNPRSGLRGWG